MVEKLLKLIENGRHKSVLCFSIQHAKNCKALSGLLNLLEGPEGKLIASPAALSKLNLEIQKAFAEYKDFRKLKHNEVCSDNQTDVTQPDTGSCIE